MLRHLLQLGDMPHFKGQIMAGGEPLPAALGQQILKAYPQAGLGDIYGLTETGTSDFFVLPPEYNLLAGTIGRSGTEVEWRLNPQSQELEIRSPWGMLGYLDLTENTNTALQDGWFKTGDLAIEEKTGVLRLIGREKDLIVRSGNKISPLEVEAIFLRHKEVETALVTGVLDPDRGEAIHLAIVLREKSQTSSNDLKVWASEYLERYKLPDKIHFVKKLPIGNTGKVDRKALRRSIELDIHIVN
jgi:malonyl-CoA/methylmalonyl-CoA synthetase